jgi:hypothetical protein
MSFLDGQVANFSEDFEREFAKDLVYLQADREEYERRIMQEILEEENRLPAKVTVIYENKPQPDDEFKDDTISLRGTNQEGLFT